MERGGKIAVGLGVGCLGFIILGVIGLSTCTVCTGAAISAGMEESAQQEQAREAENQDQQKQVPWLKTVESNCERYKGAPNDIQKSAIFNENQDFVKGKQLVGVRGELVSASTGHGGGGLLLVSKVGNAEFLHSAIGENDPLYAKAANLVIGQCVVFSGVVRDTQFSGGILEPAEQARICRMNYRFTFDSIDACPQ
jgi:hypothetical protein